jgi:hypothetical protein
VARDCGGTLAVVISRNCPYKNEKKAVSVKGYGFFLVYLLPASRITINEQNTTNSRHILHSY